MDAGESTHAAAAHQGDHAHPAEKEYIGIAIILAIVTAVEVGLYYLDLPSGLLITLLLAFAAVKFVLVVMFFMHLKFDSKIFSWFFASAFAVATLAFFAVLAMFRVFAT